MPLFQEAGTWRGSDMAAAATIVARSTRLVHMIASSNECVRPKFQVTHRGPGAMPAMSVRIVGIDRHALSEVALTARAGAGAGTGARRARGARSTRARRASTAAGGAGRARATRAAAVAARAGARSAARGAATIVLR